MRECQGEEKTIEGGAEEYCAKNGMGRSACGEKAHAHREGDIFGHGTYET